MKIPRVLGALWGCIGFFNKPLKYNAAKGGRMMMVSVMHVNAACVLV